VDSLTYDYMKSTNPGPLKGIVPVACGAEFGFPPILASDKAPPELTQKFADILVNAHKDPQFKTYHPLMKTMKFRFVRVDFSDYKSFFDLYNLAVSKKWDAGFRTWNKYFE